MHQNRKFLNPVSAAALTLMARVSILFWFDQGPRASVSPDQKDLGRKTMAKYLQCSECGKLAFYYDDLVGTEKPFYRRFMRYPEGETKYEPPRCFNCGGVPRLIHENIKEEKPAAKH
jgi:hypothetical protein